MKRDMGVVRQILLAIEATPHGQFTTFEKANIEGIDSRDFMAYARLLHQAGLIENANCSSSGAACSPLTWEGHDFLAAIRSDTVWNKMKGKVAELGAAVPLTLIKEVGLKYGREFFGL